MSIPAIGDQSAGAHRPHIAEEAPPIRRVAWLTLDLPTACAALLIAISFAAYASRFTSVGRWEASDFDPADYRFVAEYFWRVPFEPDTYDRIWNGGWGSFLRTVPFRGIGLGSLYLLVGSLRFGHAPTTAFEVQTAGILLAAIEKVLLASVLMAVFVVLRRRWGAAVGFISLAAVAFPPHFWRFCDDFITEPVARILFLAAFACTIAMSGHRSRNGLAVAVVGLFFCAAQLKVQWSLVAILLLPAMLWHVNRRRGAADDWPAWRSTAILCGAVALVPLSVLTVNWVGWRTTKLNPGVGIHINLRYGGDVLRRYAATPDGANAPFSDAHMPWLRWWNIYVGSDITREQYEAFDRYAQHYMRTHPGMALRAFWEGLTLASTVPGLTRIHGHIVRVEPPRPPWSTLIRCLDVLVWLVLIAGLRFEATRVPCSLALALWLVPAVGNVFSPYEIRYHLPMAGLGASAACVVVAHTLGRKGFIRLPAPEPVVQ